MWLGHLISCLSCVKSSGIALTGISPNTSSAYEEKKLAQTYTTSTRKKNKRGGRGAAYIGPDLLSRFEIQTGTKAPQTWPHWGTHFSRGSYNRPQLMISAATENLGTFRATAENSLCFLLFISFLHFKIVFVYFKIVLNP